MADDSYVVFVKGISALRELDTISEDIKTAARRAVGRATDKTRTAASRMMREQINWTSNYVDEKLKASTRERDGVPEGVIRATFRPTSLAQFATGTKTPWKPVAGLRVDPARYVSNKRMIIVPLRVGKSAITEDNMNRGLAIRLRQGETIHGKYKMRQLDKGLYLLYGPSISQVFYSVADDVVPDAEKWLEDEFARQIQLGNRK